LAVNDAPQVAVSHHSAAFTERLGESPARFDGPITFPADIPPLATPLQRIKGRPVIFDGKAAGRLGGHPEFNLVSLDRHFPDGARTLVPAYPTFEAGRNRLLQLGPDVLIHVDHELDRRPHQIAIRMLQEKEINCAVTLPGAKYLVTAFAARNKGRFIGRFLAAACMLDGLEESGYFHITVRQQRVS
jgi:hypothetical protein